MAKAKAAAKAAPAKNSLFAKRLKGMKEAWNKAKEESAKGGGFGSNPNVEDGDKLARLTDAQIRGDENVVVVFEFTIIEGDETGEKLSRVAGFDSHERLVYLQRDLRRMGVAVDELDPEQLEPTLAELVQAAPTVHLAVKTNGEYQNVYVNKLAEDGDVVEGEPGAEGEPGEEPEDEPEGEPDDEPEEPEEEEPDAEAYTPKVKDKVSFEWKGKRYPGTIKKIKSDGTITVVTASGKPFDVTADLIEEMAEVG